MKSGVMTVFVCSLLVSTSIASTTLINADVDRGDSEDNYSGTPALVLGDAGDYWNAMVAPFDSDNTDFGPFLASDGTTQTSIEMKWTSPYHNTWDDGGSTVFAEYFYLESMSSATFTISGLESYANYTLILYGISPDGNNAGQFTIDGVTKSCTNATIGDDLEAGKQYVVFVGSVDETGVINILLEDGNGTAKGILNGFQLEYLPGVVDFVTEHDPDDGEVEVAIDLSDRTIANNLSWTAPDDPNIVEIKGYDIYLDPNDVKVLNRDSNCLIADSTAAGVTQYDPSADFDYSATLYWTVDTRYTSNADPNLGTPTEKIFVGAPSAWRFVTKSAVPSIDTYDSVITTSALLPASLSAVVSDGDNNLSSAAFTLLDDDLAFPSGAVASLQNESVSNLYAPSVELTTDTPGIYKVLLTVSDGTSVIQDIAEVVIYADACDAAQTAPSWNGFNTMDFDTDCDVDLDDLAAFVLEWLKDSKLDAQENYTANPQYSNEGVTNGDFETGELSDYWHTSNVSVSDVGPIEGTYSAVFAIAANDEGGVTQWVNNLAPNQTYRFSLQISGGTAVTEIQVRNFGGSTITAPATDGTLQTVAIDFTTEATDQSAEIVVYERQPSVPSTIKIDDMHVVVAP